MPRNSKMEPVRITCRLETQTPKAWLVVLDKGPEAWVPKSHCDLVEHADIEGYYQLTIPEWMAERKGLLEGNTREMF